MKNYLGPEFIEIKLFVIVNVATVSANQLGFIIKILDQPSYFSQQSPLNPFILKFL